ncbi:MAG TPA: hypothetical protein VGC54_07090, partial [Planctomycetota bacterium]
LALLVGGGTALYFAVLVVSPWYLPDLTNAGIPARLLLHVVGAMALLIAAAFWGHCAPAPDAPPAGTPAGADSA